MAKEFKKTWFAKYANIAVVVPALDKNGEPIMMKAKKGDRERELLNTYSFQLIPRPTGPEGRVAVRDVWSFFTVSEDAEGKLWVNDTPAKAGNTRKQIVDAVEDIKRTMPQDVLTEEEYEKYKNPQAFGEKKERQKLQSEKDALADENKRLREQIERLSKKG